LFLTPLIGLSQELREKESAMKSHLWLGLWDFENSDEKFIVDTIGYDEIPRDLEFRGILVEALKWDDILGTNILVLTQTGAFNIKENSTDNYSQEKAELSAYLFRKGKKGEYIRKWKIHDYAENFGVDMYVGFVKRSITISDVDKDGVSEVSIPYQLIVRGGMDPGEFKIIMYENSDKYAVRGSTAICYEDENGDKLIYGGEYVIGDKLKANKPFSEFLKERWEVHKCEEL
jgi:hypothetical protein